VQRSVCEDTEQLAPQGASGDDADSAATQRMAGASHGVLEQPHTVSTARATSGIGSSGDSTHSSSSSGGSSSGSSSNGAVAGGAGPRGWRASVHKSFAAGVRSAREGLLRLRPAPSTPLNFMVGSSGSIRGASTSGTAPARDDDVHAGSCRPVLLHSPASWSGAGAPVTHADRAAHGSRSFSSAGAGAAAAAGAACTAPRQAHTPGQQQQPEQAEQAGQSGADRTEAEAGQDTLRVSDQAGGSGRRRAAAKAAAGVPPEPRVLVDAAAASSGATSPATSPAAIRTCPSVAQQLLEPFHDGAGEAAADSALAGSLDLTAAGVEAAAAGLAHLRAGSDGSQSVLAPLPADHQQQQQQQLASSSSAAGHSASTVHWRISAGVVWHRWHIAQRKITDDTLAATSASMQQLLAEGATWLVQPEARRTLAAVMPAAVSKGRRSTGVCVCACVCVCVCVYACACARARARARACACVCACACACVCVCVCVCVCACACACVCECVCVRV
jgi:hypothetical protein